MPSINTSDRALVKLGLARELTSLLGAVHHPPHLSHPSQKPRVPDTRPRCIAQQSLKCQPQQPLPPPTPPPAPGNER
ncbi:hypothetical protein CCHR01_16205 [Colletotrichum chrysophilum]|uniref:Uncharacterized protein n=1 Tax=Colletotrichum chrysophilum TaxID=1836956 RepID=A0AAD9EAN8_9PEZI|nr:hypothetical protein CCHR01_16205 [Colletotrichum chrysophilum]